METRYRHTQFGTMILFAIGPVLLFLLILLFARPSGLAIVLFAVMAIIMVTFCSMTVLINDQAVIIHFGPGLLRIHFHLKEILNCRVIDNPALSFWGIHWVFPGWIYNVSGRQSVEMTMKAGNPVLIGTDEPDKLAAAIEDALMALKAG